MRYRKKPVVVEAVQWIGDIKPIHDFGAGYTLRGTELFIETLEGAMRANPGDWIIKGVAGEFYPCRDAIFRLTYEILEGQQD